MKKLFLGFLFLVLGAGTLVGCQKQADQDPVLKPAIDIEDKDKENEIDENEKEDIKEEDEEKKEEEKEEVVEVEEPTFGDRFKKRATGNDDPDAPAPEPTPSEDPVEDDVELNADPREEFAPEEIDDAAEAEDFDTKDFQDDDVDEILSILEDLLGE